MKVAGLVYARWCPHCHSLMPHWEQMKNKIGTNCKVVEIEDGDYDKQHKINEVNDMIHGDNQLNIHGYPTLFKVNDGKVDYYNGVRDVESMSSFFDIHNKPMVKKYRKTPFPQLLQLPQLPAKNTKKNKSKKIKSKASSKKPVKKSSKKNTKRKTVKSRK